MKTIKNMSLIGIILLYISCGSNNNKEYMSGGYVKDAQTAIEIAEAHWLPIYGNDVLHQKPYFVTLEDSMWIIEGTLPDNMLGGVACIEIRQSDGKVLKVTHGK